MSVEYTYKGKKFTFAEEDVNQNTTEKHLPGGYNYAGPGTYYNARMKGSDYYEALMKYKGKTPTGTKPYDKPINMLDAAAQKHDKVYDDKNATTEEVRKSDKDLMNAAKKFGLSDKSRGKDKVLSVGTLATFKTKHFLEDIGLINMNALAATKRDKEYNHYVVGKSYGGARPNSRPVQNFVPLSVQKKASMLQDFYLSRDPFRPENANRWNDRLGIQNNDSFRGRRYTDQNYKWGAFGFTDESRNMKLIMSGLHSSDKVGEQIARLVVLGKDEEAANLYRTTEEYEMIASKLDMEMLLHNAVRRNANLEIIGHCNGGWKTRILANDFGNKYPNLQINADVFNSHNFQADHFGPLPENVKYTYHQINRDIAYDVKNNERYWQPEIENGADVNIYQGTSLNPETSHEISAFLDSRQNQDLSPEGGPLDRSKPVELDSVGDRVTREPTLKESIKPSLETTTALGGVARGAVEGYIGSKITEKAFDAVHYHPNNAEYIAANTLATTGVATGTHGLGSGLLGAARVANVGGKAFDGFKAGVIGAGYGTFVPVVASSIAVGMGTDMLMEAGTDKVLKAANVSEDTRKSTETIVGGGAGGAAAGFTGQFVTNALGVIGSSIVEEEIAANTVGALFAETGVPSLIGLGLGLGMGVAQVIASSPTNRPPSPTLTSETKEEDPFTEFYKTREENFKKAQDDYNTLAKVNNPSSEDIRQMAEDMAEMEKSKVEVELMENRRKLKAIDEGLRIKGMKTKKELEEQNENLEEQLHILEMIEKSEIDDDVYLKNVKYDDIDKLDYDAKMLFRKMKEFNDLKNIKTMDEIKAYNQKVKEDAEFEIEELKERPDIDNEETRSKIEKEMDDRLVEVHFDSNPDEYTPPSVSDPQKSIDTSTLQKEEKEKEKKLDTSTQKREKKPNNISIKQEDLLDILVQSKCGVIGLIPITNNAISLVRF